ncbi:MAG: HAD-IC family P-type ATPase [Candidatus Limiplasma sp.]|nr:HAD-IC family P-type ATPase [Candidatus Limiplasma sp.]
MQSTPLGLTGAQAAQRQPNRLPHPADGGVRAIIRRNVFTLFNLLNLLLAALLLWVGSYRNLLFMGVVVGNTVIGLIQELRAKRMHDRLLLLSEGKVTVWRDGALCPLPPGDLVLGDVIRLRRGDQTPADARVLAGQAELNEALLTGEAEPVPKAAGDALLSGSYVTEGEVTAELTAVGENSFAGQLQQSARKVKRPKSALMDSLTRIIRVVSVTLAPIGLLLYWKQTAALHIPLPEAVTKTVGAAIGMIPEGLMLLTSVALAVGVVRLGQRRALVNELYGIENLARVDTLCLDKTGTLTSGRMRVAGLHPLPGVPEADARAALCALTQAFAAEDTPTLQALAEAYPPDPAAQAVAQVPFSSERKWSAASFAGQGTLLLGAPERLAADDAALLADAHARAAQGLRVLCVQRTAAPLQGKALPPQRVTLALLSVSDTLRPDARDTLAYFQQQGVAIKIMSGDSPLTVSRIAREAGMPGWDQCVDVSALAAPDHAALASVYTIFGRVSPEDKRALIAALKAQGRTVAMVGDGVNDVPALKAADCSLAMAGGSDAAARVAQITLLDADFAVVPHILLEGRRVINNITRASALFLVKNLFSFLLSALLLALPFAYPFAPIQLTLVSTLTIGLPSFVLALQPNRERVRGDFLTNVLLRALPGGITVASLCLGLMYLGQAQGLDAASVSTLCTLVAGVSCLGVLTLTCLPLDGLRAALLSLMALAMALAVLILPGVFYLVPLMGAALRLLYWGAGGAVLLLLALTALLARLGLNPARARPVRRP